MWCCCVLQGLLPQVPVWLQGSADVLAIGGNSSIFHVAATLAPLAGLKTQDGATVDVSVNSEGAAGAPWLAPASRVSLEARRVWLCLEAVCMKSDDQLHSLLADAPDGELLDATSIVPKLALMFAVMEHCSLSSLTYQPSLGLCMGMLVSERLSGG